MLQNILFNLTLCFKCGKAMSQKCNQNVMFRLFPQHLVWLHSPILIIWSEITFKKFQRNYHYKIDFYTTGISLIFPKQALGRGDFLDPCIPHETEKTEPFNHSLNYYQGLYCTKGSNLSLHRQFVFSFNKPRQGYYTNPILWSILMAMFFSWLQGSPRNHFQYFLDIYSIVSESMFQMQFIFFFPLSFCSPW